MRKILVIMGTRPEVIKMAPLIFELKKYPEVLDTTVCVTAQHREMLDQTLELFDIVPDIDLDLMEHNQTLPLLTSRVMIEVTGVLRDYKPDLMLVQGDTTTVMTASLAAFYRRIPIGHVEAGLRTDDQYFPFPEEMNRRLTSVLARYHFSPTERAKQSLLREGINIDQVFVTGNTVIDAQQLILKRPKPHNLAHILRSAGISTENRKLILVTAHRRENFGTPFEQICEGLKALAERNKGISLLYPVHPNPNVRKPAFSLLQGVEGVHLLEPVEYDVMAHLMNESYFIITDSGGIQEEAPSLGKPVLVLRDKTERPEAVDAGVAKVIGPRAEAIIREGERLLRDQEEYRAMAKRITPYGDGRAAKRTISILLKEFS